MPLVQGDGHDFETLQTVPHHVRIIDCGDQRTEQIKIYFQPGTRIGMVRPISGDHMVAHAVQHFPIVAGKHQLVAAFAGCILVDKIATVDEHVCRESQVFRALSSIFGQCDKQQGYRGEALLAVDEQTPADTIRADAAFLHPYDRPGEMHSLRMPASRYNVGPQLPALRLAP